MKSPKKILLVIFNLICVGFILLISWATFYRPSSTSQANNTGSAAIICSPSADTTSCGPSYSNAKPAVGLRFLAAMLLISVIIVDFRTYKKLRNN